MQPGVSWAMTQHRGGQTMRDQCAVNNLVFHWPQVAIKEKKRKKLLEFCNKLYCEKNTFAFGCYHETCFSHNSQSETHSNQSHGRRIPEGGEVIAWVARRGKKTHDQIKNAGVNSHCCIRNLPPHGPCLHEPDLRRCCWWKEAAWSVF